MPTWPASGSLSTAAPNAIIQMDADWSHDPEATPSLLAPLIAGTADLVIGSRYTPGGQVVDWGIFRRVVSRGGSLFARIVLGLPANDLTGGFKAWRAATLAGGRLRRRPCRRLRLPGGDDLPRPARRRAHPRGADHLPRPSRGPEQDEPPDHRRGARGRPPAALGRAARPRTPARRHEAGRGGERSSPQSRACASSSTSARWGIRSGRRRRRPTSAASSAPLPRSPLAGESFVILLDLGADDPADLFPGLPVVGKRRLPITRVFRSGALTLDPFLVRGASLGAGRGLGRVRPALPVSWPTPWLAPCPSAPASPWSPRSWTLPPGSSPSSTSARRRRASGSASGPSCSARPTP